MALKFDAIIIPIFTINNGFRDWTIKVCEPIDVKTFEFKTEDKIRELTQIQNDIVSKQILKSLIIGFGNIKDLKNFTMIFTKSRKLY